MPFQFGNPKQEVDIEELGEQIGEELAEENIDDVDIKLDLKEVQRIEQIRR